MTTIEQKIEEFESVFDHPANCEEAQKRGEGCACGIVEMVTFLRQALEQVEKETREKDIEVVENYDLLADASSALTEGINKRISQALRNLDKL